MPGMTNERPTKTIVTPFCKIEVVLRTYLTGREKRGITNAFLDGRLNLDVESKKVTGIGYEAIDEAQDRALKAIVVSVGGKTENVGDAVLDLPSEDAEFVFAAVNEITNGKSDELKKTI